MQHGIPLVSSLQGGTLAVPRFVMNASGVNHQPGQERRFCPEASGFVRSLSTLQSSAMGAHRCRYGRAYVALLQPRGCASSLWGCASGWAVGMPSAVWCL